MVAWKMPTFFNVWRLTVVHSYSKKMLESGDNQIKKYCDKSCKTQKETTCMLTGPDTTSIQGDDALVHASQAPTPPSGTKPQPTGSCLSGQQNTDTPDFATHAALHV
jgi:hypothetical protein